MVRLKSTQMTIASASSAYHSASTVALRQAGEMRDRAPN
jgi:hypothetical protein